MNFSKRNKSIVDFMFIIALFGAFAITGLFVVLFGAKVYQTTVQNMDENYAKRTALSYVTEKIRAHDYDGGEQYESVAIDSHDGQSVLIFKENINDKLYVTYLFVNEGYLTEFTTQDGNDFSYDKGTKIISVKEFSVTKSQDALYHVNIVDEYDNITNFYVSLYSHVENREGNNE